MKLKILTLLVAVATPVLAQPVPTSSAAAVVKYNLDTPLDTLISDPKVKPVLVADLGKDPSVDPNYPLYKMMSLRQIAPVSNGELDDKKLARIASDLAGLR